nr:hypothetical protein [Nocardioides albus]
MGDDVRTRSEGEEAGVADQFDVTLEDPELLLEVELTTNLIVAASESDDHLSQEEIDRILGIIP